jgi:HEAT repeat protein
VSALVLWLALAAVPAAAAPAKIATQDLDTLLAKLADPALPAEERPRLVAALRKVNDPKRLERLFAVAATTTTPLDVAQAAWGALAETALDSPKEAQPLVSRWLKNPDPERRFRALQLIKEGVWDASFVPLIRAMLRKDADAENRAEAAEALGDNDVQEARPDLLRARRDKDKGVREAAKAALEELESVEEQ